jgi:hypothetical protein
MHPYDHPLHFKVFKHYIYIYHGSVSQSKMVVVQSHDIVVVVYFVPICEPDSASSVHLHGFDEVRMYSYDHSLHWKVIKHFIYIMWKCNPV